MKMSNDKVVGFYKKVLTDIRKTISAERQQVKRYLNNNWFKLNFIQNSSLTTIDYFNN